MCKGRLFKHSVPLHVQAAWHHCGCPASLSMRLQAPQFWLSTQCPCTCRLPSISVFALAGHPTSLPECLQAPQLQLSTECTCRLPSIKMADLDRFDSALNTMEQTKVPLTASVLRGVLLSAALTGKPGQCCPLFGALQMMHQQRV